MDKISRAKMPGTSYESLWVARHTCKNSFFGFTRWIWKMERKGKKTIEDWLKRMKKTFFKVFKMLSYGKMWKIEDTSFKFEYSDSY